MMNKQIILRAHHGMCLAFFEGKGYSDTFSTHMQSVLNMLESNPKITVVTKKDIICYECPNLKGEICNTPDLVYRYDKNVLELCGLSENSELYWNEFSGLVKAEILAKGKRESICGNCQWNELCKTKEATYKP